MSSDRFQNHRSRSRDKHHSSSYRGRSESSQSDGNRKKKIPEQRMVQKQPQRVKFNNSSDIKIFRKEDQPSSKGLSETQLMEYMNKIENQKGSSLYSMNWDSNWDNAKHRDAQLENNSIKQQKEKEKLLTEKLYAMKQEMEFYSPLLLNLPPTEIKIEAPGYSSVEKDAHTVRLNDVLGCFYAHWKQIPAQPTFQIQNKSTKSTSQPKNISFDKLMFNDIKDLAINEKGSQIQKNDGKPVKGILKLSPQELKKQQQQAEGQPGKIDPNLINIIRQINANKGLYTKEKTQILLKPYKQSGELDYLMKNPQILNGILRSGSATRSQPPLPTYPSSSSMPSYPARHSSSPQPQFPTDGFRQPIRTSADRSSSPYQQQTSMQNSQYRYQQPPQQSQTHTPYQSPYQQQQSGTTSYQQGHNNSGGYQGQQHQTSYQNYSGDSSQGSQNNNNGMFINKNYRTVPCKYYHSVQGCVKANNCTYIHDEQYAGRASPLMHKYNMNVGMPNLRTYDNNDQPNDQRVSAEGGSMDRQQHHQGYRGNYHQYQQNNNQYQQYGGSSGGSNYNQASNYPGVPSVIPGSIPSAYGHNAYSYQGYPSQRSQQR